MKKPATVPWSLNISTSDLQKLKAGFIPQDQDDKWYLYSTTTTQQHISVHIVRNLHNVEMFILQIMIKPGSKNGSRETKPTDKGSGAGIEAIDDGSTAEITSITWETSRGCLTEEDAKYEAVMLIRVVLECDIEALPGYESE